MTPYELTQWREYMRWNKTRAASEIGIAINSMGNYEAGRAPVPRYVALACMALANRLPPWPWTNGGENGAA